MNRWLLLTSAFALGTFAGEAAGQASRGRSARAGWLTSYEAGRAEARRSGKPLLVVFRCEP